MTSTRNQPSSYVTSRSQTISESDKAALKDMIQVVRQKMRDYEQLNRLVEGREHSNRDVAAAMYLALNDWNTAPPLLEKVTLVSHPAKHLLIDRTIIELLLSAAILMTRNHMNYSDAQGTRVGVSDKAPQYLQLVQLLMQKYEAARLQTKQAINLNDAIDGTSVSSEYVTINGVFDFVDLDF